MVSFKMVVDVSYILPSLILTSLLFYFAALKISLFKFSGILFWVCFKTKELPIRCTCIHFSKQEWTLFPCWSYCAWVSVTFLWYPENPEKRGRVKVWLIHWRSVLLILIMWRLPYLCRPILRPPIIWSYRTGSIHTGLPVGRVWCIVCKVLRKQNA